MYRLKNLAFLLCLYDLHFKCIFKYNPNPDSNPELRPNYDPDQKKKHKKSFRIHNTGCGPDLLPDISFPALARYGSDSDTFYLFMKNVCLKNSSEKLIFLSSLHTLCECDLLIFDIKKYMVP
jgi:hypothetical protein